MWLVTEGEATLSCDYGEYNLHRGDFLVMPFYKHEYYGRQNKNNMLEVIWMIIQVQDINGQGVNTDSINGLPFYTRLHDISFVEQLFMRIIHSNDFMFEYWTRILLDEVRRQVNIHNESYRESCVREICEKIKVDPARYNKLDILISEYGISKDYLIRLFRRYCGVTPGEFIIRTRIDMACNLLAVSSLSIKQIAAQLGYSDQFCFSRQFKARKNVSPREYRASLSSG